MPTDVTRRKTIEEAVAQDGPQATLYAVASVAWDRRDAARLHNNVKADQWDDFARRVYALASDTNPLL